MSLLRAPAKINLALEVIGRRPDGLHELVSVMQTVSLSDVVRCEPGGDLRFLTTDERLRENNLVERAACLMRPSSDAGGKITLHKSIPVAAGLGGGSSDAAAAIIGLNEMWDLGLTCEALVSRAESLGSDVPFFLYGGTCLVQGRGERVIKLREPAVSWYLLVNPRISVSTGDVFRALDQREWSDGSEAHALARQIDESGRVGPGPNGLQDALFRVCPPAKDCFDIVCLVAPRAWITGTGPTVVAQFASEAAAMSAMVELAPTGYWTSVVSSTPSPKGMPCS